MENNIIDNIIMLPVIFTTTSLSFSSVSTNSEPKGLFDHRTNPRAHRSSMRG